MTWRTLMEVKLMKNQDENEDIREELKKIQIELEKTQLQLVDLETKNIQLQERMRMAEDDHSAVKGDLIATKEELTITKNDLTTAKGALICQEDLKLKDHELEREISFLKNPPFFHACGAHWSSLYITNQIIPYSTLLYSSTNTEGGDLDTSS